jgi:hypothetical protein
MKILINEEVNKKVFGLFQRLIDEELSRLETELEHPSSLIPSSSRPQQPSS